MIPPSSIWQDYLQYLEDVDAFGWYLVSDERKLAAYTRRVRPPPTPPQLLSLFLHPIPSVH